MNTHPYGEKILNLYAPPSGTTGLIIRQWYERDEAYPEPNWFTCMVFGKRKQRYFVFHCISGSYDYECRYNGSMCGGYVAKMGYWHYPTEAERDEKYKSLIKESK